MSRASAWIFVAALHAVVIVHAGQADPGLNAVRSAATAYLQLAEDVHGIAVAQGGLAAHRAKLLELLADRLDGAELERWQRVIQAQSLEGEGMLEALRGIRPIGPPMILVGAVNDRSTLVDVECEVLETFKLDMNLESVSSLFRRYTITNYSESRVAALANQDDMPERYTFEVRTRKKQVLSMVQTARGWRVAQVESRDLSSRLSVVVFQGGRRTVILE